MTEKHRRPRGRSRLLPTFGLTVLFVVAWPATAQRTIFDPSFTLGLFHTDNVQFVGSGDTSDSGLVFGLELPVRRELEKGTLDLRYGGALRRYDRSRQLEDDRHRLELQLNTRPARRSSLAIRAGYARTQDQGDPTGTDEADFFLRRRTEREQASLRMSYRQQPTRLWAWGFSAAVSDWSFEEAPGLEGDSGGEPLEDRTALQGSLSLNRSVSAQGSVGVRYGYRRFDLQVSGEETVHQLSLVMGREIVDRLSLQVAVGGFDTSQRPEAAVGDGRSDSRSGVQGSISLSRSTRAAELSLTAGHSPSVGGARVGTSVSSFLALSVRGRAERKLGWAASARFALRDPNEPDQPETESLALGASLTRDLGRRLKLRLSGRFVDQSESGGGGETRDSYTTAALTLAFHPRGRSRLP